MTTDLEFKKNAPAPILREHRPWGWFEVLARGPRHQIKRINVDSGKRLSLQRHYHRSENWTVVSGTGSVTVGDVTWILSEGESVKIPTGAVHRVMNPGKIPLVFIEVQFGMYLEEDDIVRLEDDYGRANEKDKVDRS